jgi:uncharacterized membrane protein YidH (DUF202 family)
LAALKVLTALYLILIAAAVAVQFIAGLFYDPATEGAADTVWTILNPLMVAGVVIVVLMALNAKRRRDADSDNRSIDRDYLEANVVFYFSIVLLLVLLWNWISTQWVDPPGAISLLWIFVDTTFPILLGSVGVRLLRGDSAFDCFPKQ